jgi:hypothetical protein
MAGTTSATTDDRLACEKCHGFYAVEVPEGPDAKPRVRCNACGHIRELDIAPVQKPEEKGKWTVIGPDGKVMTFGSWEKLVGSGRPPALAEEKKVSASSLLDITPPIAGPKLSLDDLESNPVLPVQPSRPPAKNGPVWAPAAKETKKDEESARLDLAPESSEEAAPLSLRDAIVEDSEPAPLSLRDAIPEDDETSPLSLKDIASEKDIKSDRSVTRDAESSDQHEVVSLDDVTLVDTGPHPPARGTLTTLPPTRPKGDVAPPPTINVEEPPVDSEAETAKLQPKTLSKKPPPEKTPAPAKSAPAPAKTTTPVKSAAKPSTASAVVREEPPKRNWLVPTVAVAAGAIIVWRLMAASPNTPAPAPVSATTTAETTATTAQTPPTEATAATESTAASASASAASTAAPTTAAASPTTTTATAETSAPAPVVKATSTKTTAASAADPESAGASAEKKAAAAAPADTAVSMSDLLDRAGSARRSGDYATARELYEKVIKQNPGNVEANGGLGDVARAQGDLAGAKASYERALAASPSYGPAQLGLADTEWDQGNHASAQQHYAKVVEQLGRRAPDRARQRSTPSE